MGKTRIKKEGKVTEEEGGRREKDYDKESG